jgi:hypothetical protein
MTGNSLNTLVDLESWLWLWSMKIRYLHGTVQKSLATTLTL